MKRIIFYLSFLFIFVSASDRNLPNHSPSANMEPKTSEPKKEITLSAKSVDIIIPYGWKILERVKGEPEKAEGDLNKDGIPDIAAIIEQTTDETEEASPRALLIAFGTNDNSYSLSIIADKVILKADEGGIWGDPFESISIDRGSVLVSDYGGSNWRWYNKYRFRYQDNDWYLIGATMGEYYTGTQTLDNSDEGDYNLLTGEYTIRTTNENGKISVHKGNRGRKELIKLKDFNLEDM